MTSVAQSGAVAGASARSPEAGLSEAAAHVQADRLDEAERILAHLIEAMPECAVVHHQAGILSHKRGRIREALTRMEQSLRLKPDEPLFHRNIAEIYRLESRLEDALDHARRAVSLAPDEALGYYNLGVIQYDRMEIEQAIHSMRRALQLDDTMAAAHFELAETLLLSGRFEEGWREYEWRFHMANSPRLLPSTDRPLWDGQPMPGGTVLLIGDQGFGDSIQFSRYIPEVAKRCATVIVACSRDMHPIVEQQAGVVQCFDRWDDVPAFDAYCPLSGLPRLFGTRVDTIPAASRYLKPDAQQALQWRTRLDRLVPAGYRRIGLVWAGRPTHGNDFNRSMRLQQLERLSGLEGVALVSLQMGPAQAEIGRYFGAAPLFNLGAEIRDFSDTMAILAGVERLVSVDTAVAHLAGAMGVPVSLMLPYAPDWRWLMTRTDTPWYPGMTLCRQRTPGQWQGAIEQLLDTLGI
jgi:Flp pilus assembly protein TadD